MTDRPQEPVDEPRWPKESGPFRVEVKRQQVLLLDRFGDEWGRMASRVEAERLVEILNREVA